MARAFLLVVIAWCASTFVPVAVADAAGPPYETYVVHPGDTLYRIAISHDVTVSQLAEENRIVNPGLIYPGRVLRIPDPEPPIFLDNPSNGERVPNPVQVTGRANTFEGQVNVRILDSRFQEVGSGYGIAAMGEYRPFSITVRYSVPHAQWGYVDVFWISPRDGREMNKVTARVYLQAGGDVSLRYHTVRRGETLYSIARRYGVTIWQIAAANGIRNVNLIYAGQRLIIP